MLRYHEAFGGPLPPPIDHQGINVDIWEGFGRSFRYGPNGLLRHMDVGPA
jgi:hypothetical protein